MNPIEMQERAKRPRDCNGSIVSIFRSRERSEHYESQSLAQKTEEVGSTPTSSLANFHQHHWHS